MSLTSSLELPPNDIETVESGWEPAGAELGLTVKSVMLNAASADAGGTSKASAVRATDMRAARQVSSHENLRAIACWNDSPVQNLRKYRRKPEPT